MATLPRTRAADTVTRIYNSLFLTCPWSADPARCERCLPVKTWAAGKQEGWHEWGDGMVLCPPCAGIARTLDTRLPNADSDPFNVRGSNMRVTAVVEYCKETELYVGYVPGFPGAHSQGETLDELSKRLKEAIAMLIEEGVEPSIDSEFIGIQQIEVP